jgi:hypothetical protein
MTKEDRQLTEMQQKFLDVLFGAAKGNFVEAKRLAGYSENYSTRHIVDGLQDEITELTKKFIARAGARAAYSMYEVLEDPTALGNKERMAAAKDLLDRGGFKPQEQIKIETETPLFILPAKASQQE